jgi:hypothetical protein
MSLIATKPNSLRDELSLQEIPSQDRRARQARLLRVLWDHRQLLVRATAIGLLFSGLLTFTIPKSYTSTAQLMPPDSQSNSGIAMMAALAAKGAGGLGSMAADLLGLNSTGALFVGILRSDAAQSRLVEQFDLKKVYGVRLEQDAREALDERTVISEDRKSGIISISVTDHSPERAAALARAYVDQLNSLISELSTSSAHRERAFLEERLTVAKHELDEASNGLAQFSSQNGTVDIQTMGKAALDAAGTLAGELIVAQSELQGLRQIYSDEFVLLTPGWVNFGETWKSWEEQRTARLGQIPRSIPEPRPRCAPEDHSICPTQACAACRCLESSTRTTTGARKSRKPSTSC